VITHWIFSIGSRQSRSFWVAFAFLILSGLLMRPSSSCLITPATPYAIVDLELSYNQAKAESIKELWESHQCTNSFAITSNGSKAAVLNIIIDFIFIGVYTYFFIVLIVLSQQKVKQRAKWTRILIMLALTIGLFDVIENLFMILFLLLNSITSYLFAIPASIKFGLILLLITAIIIRMVLKMASKKTD